jgi:phosphoglycerate kinase
LLNHLFIIASVLLSRPQNLRFHFEECGSGLNAHGDKVKCSEADVAAFKQALARLGDVFVFEGFGAAHRPHASIVGCAEPGSLIKTRVSGLLVEKEIAIFADVLSTPRRPFLAIVGGSKVTDKIAVLENLLDLVDVLFIGGAMAYTFKKVLGELEIGSSLFDEAGAGMVKAILAKASKRKVKVLLPTDHVIGDAFSDKANTGLVGDKDGVPPGWMALDLGPASRAALSAQVEAAQTVLWNGPLGVCEFGAFSGGTLHVMTSVVAATARGATTVLGGGDTGAAARRFFVGAAACADLVTHSSTGGGTALVLMEGNELPAVTALTDRS